MASKEAHRQSRPCKSDQDPNMLNSNPIQEFVAEVSLAPPTVSVDPELMRQYQAEMEQAAGTALPDEEDADL